MDEKVRSARSPFAWQWPAIISIVVLMLMGIQILRVNRRGATPAAANSEVTYSTPGPILSGDLKIDAGDFLANRITLNRQAKLSGEFQTGSVKNRVAIVVVDEQNFAKWNQQIDFTSRVRTGYVPGGKISPVLEAGTYFLIIDNRANAEPRSVHADFALE